MKKNNKRKQKKGFTLVELLAVIIILAIIVGITVPAVLTTTGKAKEKAFKTAAETAANWVDKQYEIYKSGIYASGITSLDPVFEATCIRTCHDTDENCTGEQFNGKSDYYNKYDSDKCNCNCDNRVAFLTNEFLESSGINPKNISLIPLSHSSYRDYNGIRVRHVDNKYIMITVGGSNNTSLLSFTTTYSGLLKNWARVYINPETGKSCITLHSSNNGDYPANKTVCGGVCQSDVTTSPDYCKET